MRKIILFSIIAIILSGCNSFRCFTTRKVMTMEQCNKSIDQTNLQLAEQGYRSTGKHTTYQNYSTPKEDPSKKKKKNDADNSANKPRQYTIDTYRFTNNNGEGFEYTVKYLPECNELDSNYYTAYASVIGCKTSTAATFEQMCGDQSVAYTTFKDLPKEEVQFIDYNKRNLRKENLSKSALFLVVVGVGCLFLPIPVG